MTGSMLPGRLVGLSMAVVMAAALVPTPAAALSWAPQVRLRHSDEPARVSAAFSGPTAVTGWVTMWEPGPLFARVSDTFAAWLPRVRLADEADLVATAACGGYAAVAWTEPNGFGALRLMLAVKHPDGPALVPGQVHGSLDAGGDLAVACGGGRVWVVWTEPDGAIPHTWAVYAPIATLAWSAIIDLGVTTQQGIAVAATNRLAVVTFTTLDRLQVARFSMSRSPDGPVTALPTRTLVTGVITDPLVAAYGERVAVGYTRRRDAWIRLSSDRGLTFAAPRKLAENGTDEDGPTGAWFESLAVRGSRVVATLARQFPPVPAYLRQRTSDFGGHWTSADLGLDLHLMGFVRVSGATFLADVYEHMGWWDEPMNFDIWFRRQT